MSVQIVFRRLTATDLVDGFDAGTSPDEMHLTKYFRDYSKVNQANRRSVTWLAVARSGDEENIAGFVTTCPGAVEAQQIRKLDRGLPGYPAAVLLLARIATAASYRRQGVATALVDLVMHHAENLANEHGCVGVLTHAKPSAVGFYERTGFARLVDNTPEGHTVEMARLLPRKQTVTAAS